MIKKSGADWQYDRRIRRRGSRRQLQDLSRAIDRCLSEADRAGSDMTVADAAAAYLRDGQVRRLAASSIRRYEEMLLQIVDSLPPEMTVGGLSFGAVEDRRNSWAQRLAPSVVNARLDLLCRLVRWAIATRRYCRPDGSMPDWLAVRRLPVDSRPRRALPLDELIRRIDGLPQHLRLVCRLMLLTCARPQALVAACWRDVVWPTDSRDGLLRLPTLKRGLRGDIQTSCGGALHAALVDARRRWEIVAGRAPRGGRVRDPLLLSARGSQWTVQSLDNAMRWAQRAVPGADRIQPYTIRRSVLTWAWTQAAAAPGAVQALAKHTRFSTTEGYVLEASSAVALRLCLESAVTDIDGGSKW